MGQLARGLVSSSWAYTVLGVWSSQPAQDRRLFGAYSAQRQQRRQWIEGYMTLSALAIHRFSDAGTFIVLTKNDPSGPVMPACLDTET
jgi:hypothetical protein